MHRFDLRPGRHSAFTLPEVMVSLALMGMFFGSAFAALGQGFILVEVSRDITRASQILQSEMENIRTMNWSDIDALPASASFTPDSRFSEHFAERYSCTRAVTTRKVNQKLVTLTVSWTDSREREHSHSYVTFVTKEGLNDYYYRTL